MRSIVRTLIPIVAIVVLTVTAAAQSPQDPQPNSPSQGSAPDLLEQLRLTPEQQQKIRQIQRDTKDERSVIGLRLRESNRALEDALDAEVLDDSLIEQRMQAVSAAQAAQLRLRIQTEVRIRRVLNPDQLAVWHDLRLKAGDVLRGRQDNRPLRPGVNGLRPNQGNGMAPLDRRNEPVRNPRP
ncbi:MAG TPA: periplasmic heavy metal sensor [Pyrinomonadaceae bacterium]|jgi:P pilus assembly/Cpx signaling pathway, periplasmic inhibitor/zinc-resistance associated protein|nr:periplasmic heavy metal sensor [Pyrinomonadaceae bacterium]